MFCDTDDPLACEEYESALRANREARERITALLTRRDELPQWLVEALEAILEEVL